MSSSDSSAGSSSFFSSAAAGASPPAAAPPAAGAAAAPPPEPTFDSRSFTSLPSRALAKSDVQMGSTSATLAALIRVWSLSAYIGREKEGESCQCHWSSSGCLVLSRLVFSFLFFLSFRSPPSHCPCPKISHIILSKIPIISCARVGEWVGGLGYCSQ